MTNYAMSNSMPRQRLAYKKKTKNWRKDTVDYIDGRYSTRSSDGATRNSIREKMINQRLFEGFVDVKDMAKYINPYDIKGLKVPKNVAHHNIIVPKLNTLIGEESKRQFEYTVVVTTPNAVSDKLDSKKKAIDEKLTALLEQKFNPAKERIAAAKEQGMDTAAMEEKLQSDMDAGLAKISKYSKYNWKDLREVAANRLLKHYSAELNFKRLFNDGFKDALILGEEIYQLDIYDNEPMLHRLNPVNVYTVKTSNSSYIEDADIILVEDYWSPGKVIDNFYNELKPEHIDEISDEGTSTSSFEMDREFETPPIVVGVAGQSDEMNNVEDIIQLAEANGYEGTNLWYDMDGNVRVLRVYWRSQKKVLKVTYYDEDGKEQFKIMSEEYKPVKELGETAKTLWINEWWEGTKIAKDIYLQMRPRRIQYNKLENPSAGSPGIIGELYNTNQGRVISMVSRMKSYQYLYDSIWDRLLKAISKNLGKILEVDVAKIPANWDVGQWFHYATTMGIGFVDSFKEGNKGAATGKLAGGFNTTGKVLDVETGNYIQSQINLLEYIKAEMSELVGINKQRQGQVSQYETVGGVERSVMQSSHITEWWYAKHDDVKARVLQAFIDTTKIALKGSKKKVQYLLDDMSIEAFIVNGDDFAETDYGLIVTSSPHTRELSQKLDGLAQAGLQSQLLKFSDLLYIYSTPSLQDIRRKIEQSEDQKAAQEAEQSKMQQQQIDQQRELAMQAAAKESERLDKELDLKAADIANDRYKIETDMRLKMYELGLSGGIEPKDDDKIRLDQDKLDEVVRHNKKTEQLQEKSINKQSQKPKQ